MSGLSSPSDGFSDTRSKLSINTCLGSSDDVLDIEVLNKIMPCRLPLSSNSRNAAHTTSLADE